MGSAVSSPSGVWGGAQAANAFVGHFEPRKRVSWQQNCSFCSSVGPKFYKKDSTVVVPGGISSPWIIYEAVCLIPPLSRRPCTSPFPALFLYCYPRSQPIPVHQLRFWADNECLLNFAKCIFYATVFCEVQIMHLSKAEQSVILFCK